MMIYNEILYRKLPFLVSKTTPIPNVRMMCCAVVDPLLSGIEALRTSHAPAGYQEHRTQPLPAVRRFEAPRTALILASKIHETLAASCERSPLHSLAPASAAALAPASWWRRPSRWCSMFGRAAGAAMSSRDPAHLRIGAGWRQHAHPLGEHRAGLLAALSRPRLLCYRTRCCARRRRR